jgi:hypothetical protein
MRKRRIWVVFGALVGAGVLVALAATTRTNTRPGASLGGVREANSPQSSTLRLPQAPFNPLAPGWSPLE